MLAMNCGVALRICGALSMLAFGTTLPSYTLMNSTYCDGPDVAPSLSSVASGEVCTQSCDTHAGCVNALYLEPNQCFLRGQCENTIPSSPGYHLYSRKDAAISQCYWEGHADTYVGSVATTVTGETCVAWVNSPYYTYDDFPEDTLAAAENFCRTPDGYPNLWCNTVNSWDYCNITKCSPYAGAYTLVEDVNCPYNDLAFYDGLSTEECHTHCDANVNCVAVVFHGRCFLKSTCSSYGSAPGVMIYIRMDIPGWSTYLNKDCGGNDIEGVTVDTPHSCVQLCVGTPHCVAVIISLSGSCFLKTRCTQLINLPGWHSYRLLDREVSGYSKVSGMSLETYDVQQGIDNGETFSVTQVWQCAAWCRKCQSSCGCFEVKQTLTEGDTNCFIKERCNSINFVAGLSDMYIPAEFNVSGFRQVSKTWCSSSSVKTEFPTVPTAGECVNLCRQMEGCVNAVYDFYREVCYLKTLCEDHQKQPSMHHDLYEREGQWRNGHNISDCVHGIWIISRSCEGGAYCEGLNITHGDCSQRYGSVVSGKRLLDHTLDTRIVSSMTACLAFCRTNTLCTSVNFSDRWAMGEHVCELNCQPVLSGQAAESSLQNSLDFSYIKLTQK